uniref:(northern house mosquito) hypothetical protein n=1 Tax=Culex pipiens TaxID=7175 RepID=A0A8D8N496_CULPI
MGQQTSQKGLTTCRRSVRRSARWTQPSFSLGSIIWRTSSKGEGKNALPHAAERPDGARLSALQENQTGQHPGGGHRRRQPEAHPRSHLDHHSALPDFRHRGRPGGQPDGAGGAAAVGAPLHRQVPGRPRQRLHRLLAGRSRLLGAHPPQPARSHRLARLEIAPAPRAPRAGLPRGGARVRRHAAARPGRRRHQRAR